MKNIDDIKEDVEVEHIQGEQVLEVNEDHQNDEDFGEDKEHEGVWRR